MVILTVFVLWIIYSIILYKKLGSQFRLSKELVPLIFISLISTVCLGVNYAAAAVPSLNDGIGIHSFVASWMIGDDGWSVALFKKYFDSSAAIALLLVALYCVLRLIEKKTKSS